MIGGFFFERDLFPLATQNDFGAAPAATSPRCSTCSCRIPTACSATRARRQKVARRHAGHARPRVPAPDQRRPPDVREHSVQRLRGGLAERRIEPRRRGAALLSRRPGSRRARTSRRRSSVSRRRPLDTFNNVSGRQQRSLRELPRQAVADVGVRRTTTRSRRAARRGICSAISPTIAARRTATPGRSS